MWKRLPIIISATFILSGIIGCHRLQPVEQPPVPLPIETGKATLHIDARQRSTHPVPKYITGKFCEHLGSNILNGMDAQILRNPTLADFPFGSGVNHPDGGRKHLVDEAEIARALRREAARRDWPRDTFDRLVKARSDGLACWWIRLGDDDDVRVSPDTGPHGHRAQRVQVEAAGQGMAQWTYLPLHREREYDFELIARSPDLESLTVSLMPLDGNKPCASETIDGLSSEWATFNGRLQVAPDLPDNKVYRFAVATDSPGQVVIERLLLYPADHVNGADPDVIRFLRESNLPILRWPGGNFASGYHWEDGVGPRDARPTRPNPAWGGIEPNFFGTDEFIAFCRAVGCEPMICINGGDGTPDEAARWIEYCNGPPDSPMGALRAANGHPDPYGVQHWEVGNELWGRWQVHWTTPKGYADRFRVFAKAMKAADPEITLYACGAPVFWGKDWNDMLIAEAGPLFRITTDHPLIGGRVAPATDPLDVYRDFMTVPDVLEEKWAALDRQMREAGIDEPRLAVTELQMFARIGSREEGDDTPARLTRDNLVDPATAAEALYDVLIYHAALRLAPFVTMVTHSATVNHGGGLRKVQERVFANPCHYGQSMFSAFAGAVPVAVELVSPTERAPLVVPDLKNATDPREYRVIDALAALAPDGDLLVSIVHRGTDGPIELEGTIAGFAAEPDAQVRTLSADVPWATNTLEEPERISPVDRTIDVQNSGSAMRPSCDFELTLEPYSVTRIRLHPASR